MSLTEMMANPYIEPGVAIVLAFGISFAVRRLCRGSASESLGGGLLRALRKPLQYLPWIALAFYFAHQWLPHQEVEWHDNLVVLERVIYIIYPCWILWRFSIQTPALLRSTEGEWAKKVSGSVIARLIQMLILLVALGSIAPMLGYSLSTLLAFGGIGGIIIGMAARDWLANFFGGLMLMLDRPFSEGDWIRSPDRSIEGHVEQIGWRLTRIRTFDRRPLYVPNSLFTGIVVENPSRMKNRRMVENFGLRYEDQDKMPKILDRIIERVVENPDIDSNEPKYACFIRYDDSSLLCQVRVHIKRTDRVGFLRVQQWVLMTIAQAVAENGAEFAYPTRVLLSPTDNNK